MVVEVWESVPQACITIKLLQAIKNTPLGGSIDFNGAVLTVSVPKNAEVSMSD